MKNITYNNTKFILELRIACLDSRLKTTRTVNSITGNHRSEAFVLMDHNESFSPQA